MYKKIFFIVWVFTLFLSTAYSKALTVDKLLEDVKKDLKTVDTKALVKLLKQNPNTQIIDVRIQSDIVKQGGFIKANKVTRISRDKLEFMISQTVQPDEKFVVHCYDGKISALATKQLLNMGYKNAIYYKDSFKKWKEAKLPISSLDKYPESMLYSKVKKVANGVYTSIGQTSPGTYENSNHNNNLGFIVGDKAVLVWNAGGNYLLAKAFHEEIKKVTQLPVKYVVLENSQSHAMLGSSYWKEQGAIIVSQKLAKDEIIKKGETILQKKAKSLKDKILGTKIVLPDVTFKDKKVFDLGNKVVEARYFGYAHEYSDIALWLPKEKILFAGDLAFNNRVLPIFKYTQTLKWLEAWEKLASLDANIVIPGHGEVTDMATVTKYTKDYIVYMRTQIEKILDDDGGLNEAYEMNLSAYEHLDTFKELAKQNIARLFGQMEFEE
jgi:glyoxylase-like metal-dependent hydrolase (beta-lactamase superfamily II)/rhodanese-related sulfurtransferase